MNEKILIPNFNSTLQNKTFSEWFNEPKQIETRKEMIKNINKDFENICEKIDRRIINILYSTKNP